MKNEFMTKFTDQILSITIVFTLVAVMIVLVYKAGMRYGRIQERYDAEEAGAGKWITMNGSTNWWEYGF